MAATFILSACVPDIPEFSPDGRTLAFTLDNSLALIDTRTKAVRVLPDSTSGWWPSWSPDGRYIAFFVPPDEQVKLYDSVTRQTRLLAQGAIPFAWREDGRRLAAFRERGGRSEVVVLTPDGDITLTARLPTEDPPGPHVEFVVRVVRMVWVPNADTLALLAGDRAGMNLYLIEAGEVHRITMAGDVIGLGLLDTGRRLVLARGPRVTGPVTLHTYDLSNRTWVRLPVFIPSEALRPEPGFGRDVQNVIFSPGGSRLALGMRFEPRTSAAVYSPSTYQAWYTASVADPNPRRVWRTEEFARGFVVSAATWSRDGQLAIADTYYVGDLVEFELSRIVVTLHGAGGQVRGSWTAVTSRRSGSACDQISSRFSRP